MLLAALVLVAYGLVNENYLVLVAGIILFLIGFVNLYRYSIKRFVEIDDFFEAVKYRDFSRWFNDNNRSADIRNLYKGFNLVNKTFKTINNERQAQFLYLQKILEMVDVGIIAYNLETGDVLWVNESLLKLLDLPSFKNIKFVESGRPDLYDELFETYYSTHQSANLEMRGETLKVLISSTVFQVEEDAFKLVVLQNIENTLNQSESEAWKKLLSVMTHEIMNSIAPISSLSETLQNEVRQKIEKPESEDLDLEDLNAGISSIKKRSEGLMKFAKTYRTLNKVSQINKSKILVDELFSSIEGLMAPTIEAKQISIEFINHIPKLELEIDTHLIEQVLINLILNARDACADNPDGKIVVAADRLRKGVKITVSDNGKGIPAEIVDNIFVPFFSTKKTGSGIGLSLSKQIMMLHNGRIQVQSKEGQGTSINLMFN
ncbi:MAG: ATP-binding protein [Flavobacteriaceae bacterium]|nr:ATP-binding protein [Flavobacteriaceae bacterium]